MPAPLEVDYVARKQVPALVGLSVFLVLSVACWVFDVVPGWLAGTVTVVLGLVVLYGIVLVRCLGTGVRVAQLDETGIAVAGADPVPWSDLREVVLGPTRPAWLLGGGPDRTVAFLPRPGVTLPGPPGVDGRQSDRGRATRERLYGTNLMLQTTFMSVDGKSLVAAAHELGGLPVRRSGPRRLRRWLVLLGAAVAIGLTAGIMSSLVG